MSSQPVFNGIDGQGQANYDVSKRDTTDGQVQRVQLEIGTSTTVDPVSASNPLPTTLNPNAAGFFPYIDTNQAAGVGCTTTSIVCLDTSGYRVGDWVFFRDIGVLALKRVTRQIVSIDSGTAFTVSPALPATPTNGVDYFDVLRATPIPTNGSYPSVYVAGSTALSVTNGAFTELAAAIGAIDSHTPVTASGIQLAGDDPYAFDGPKVAAPYVVNQAPGASDFGLVTRNIPSGTQTVSGTVAATQSGTWNIRVMGWDVDSSSFMPIPIGGFGTYVPVSISTGMFGAGIANTGTLTGAAQTVILNTLDGYPEGVVMVSGTYSQTFAFEALKNSVWHTLPCWRVEGSAAAESSSGALVNTSRAWRFNVAGFETFRIRCSTYVSGTANVAIQMVSFGTHTSQTLLPTGQTIMANSQSVSIASDQDVEVVGNIAHDAADSGNPVKIGGKALTADPTAVATGDRVNALFDKLGKQVVLTNALLEKTYSATSASSITNTTSTSLVAATASVIRVITAITVSNMHATVSTIVNILDGTTVKWHGPAACLGGGYSISGLKLVGTVNTAINVQCVTTGASVRASVEYFEIAG